MRRASVFAKKGLFRAFYPTQVGRALQQLGITHVPPTRPRRAAAWTGSSAPCRSGCRRNCGSRRSPRSRPPTATSRSSSCPTTTPASPSRPPSPDRPSSPIPAGRSRTSCASRRTARRPAIIASSGKAAPCRSRRSATATTTSRRPLRVHEYSDGRLAVFDGPSCLARFDRNGKPANASRAA